VSKGQIAILIGVLGIAYGAVNFAFPQIMMRLYSVRPYRWFWNPEHGGVTRIRLVSVGFVAISIVLILIGISQLGH
jgi:hypothetical protein